MPAARRQAAEYRPIGRVFIEVEGLGVELGGEGLDTRGVDAHAFRTAEFLTYGEIFQIAHARATIRHGAATLKPTVHEKTQRRLQRLETGAAQRSAEAPS